MSSNDKSLYQVNAIRFSNGFTSLAISSRQNCSMGEVPTTTATCLVSGNTCKIFSIAPK